MSDSGSSFSELKDNESSGAASTSIPINTSLTHADKPLPTTVSKPASVTNATFASDYSTLFVPAPHPAYTVDWFVFYLKQTRVLIILALLVYMLILVIWITSLGKAGAMAGVAGSTICSSQWAAAELVPNIISACPPVRAEVYYAGALSSGGVRINGNTVGQDDVSIAPLAIFVPNPAPAYYYTAIFLDPDYPNRNYPTGRSNVRGIVTNLRLGESVDTNGGQWIQPYEGPHRHRPVRAPLHLAHLSTQHRHQRPRSTQLAQQLQRRGLVQQQLVAAARTRSGSLVRGRTQHQMRCLLHSVASFIARWSPPSLHHSPFRLTLPPLSIYSTASSCLEVDFE